jgi:hypothetical protein
MQELYVDDVTKGNADSNVETFDKSVSNLNAEEGNLIFCAETLESQNGVTSEIPTAGEVVDDTFVPDSPADE